MKKFFSPDCINTTMILGVGQESVLQCMILVMEFLSAEIAVMKTPPPVHHQLFLLESISISDQTWILFQHNNNSNSSSFHSNNNKDTGNNNNIQDFRIHDKVLIISILGQQRIF